MYIRTCLQLSGGFLESDYNTVYQPVYIYGTVPWYYMQMYVPTKSRGFLIVLLVIYTFNRKI